MPDKSRARKVETALAVASAVSSPLAAALKIIGSALGQPDLADTAIETLQEDIVRLHADYVAKISNLEAEVKARLNAEELVDVIMQVHANMARTASAEKRVLMRNLAVNGVDPTHANALEVRLFIQAVGDLDMVHIELLRAGIETEHNVIDAPDGDVGRSLAQGLETRGFVRPIQRAGASFGGPYNLPIPPTYEVTQLGGRFVQFLREPESPES